MKLTGYAAGLAAIESVTGPTSRPHNRTGRGRTLDGQTVTTISRRRSNDDWLRVELADGIAVELRLWYLRELIAADKHTTKIKQGA